MFLRLTSSTLALTVLTAPAFALTPEEVWNAWVTEYGRTGYAVTEGSRDLAGEVLTLRDVTFVQQGEGERLAITVPQIALTGTGDGNVRSAFSEEIAVEMQTRDADGQPVTVTGTVRAPDMEVLSSGDAAARTDRVTAPSMVMTLDAVDLPGDAEDLTDVASLTLTDLTAEAVSRDGGQTMTSTTRAAKLDYTVDYADAEGSLKATGSVADVEGSGEVTLPTGAVVDFAEQMNAALNAGAALSGTVKLGAGSHDLAFTGTSEGTEESGTMAVAVGGGELSFRVAGDGLAYQGAVSSLEADLTATGMPAPVSYALEEATFDIQGPVMASEAPAPFKFAYSLAGLTLAEEVWTQFDPSRQLPRDPASLDIDLTGQVRLTGDLFDPTWMEAAAPADGGQPGAGEAAADDPAAVEGAEAEVPAADPAAPQTGGDDPAAVEGAEAEVPAGDTTADTAGEAAGSGEDAAAAEPMPFEVTEVTINHVAINAAGVKAEATGSLAAPEGGDISEPVGTVNARYEGLNRLIDTLAAMGAIPQDQVMAYRMMLTMFTRPGEGEDVLTTELQFNQGGEIIANGQKIK